MRALTWAGGTTSWSPRCPSRSPGPTRCWSRSATPACAAPTCTSARASTRARSPAWSSGTRSPAPSRRPRTGSRRAPRSSSTRSSPAAGAPPAGSGRPHTCENLRLIGIDSPGGAAPLVAVDADRLIPVPGSPDLRHLAFAEPLAVAVRAVRRSGLQLGQTVAVVGGGPIGVAVALCARNAGAGRVVLAEPAPARREFAAGLGLETVASAEGLAAEVVFDAAGHPAVAALVTDLVAPGGTVVVVAVYGDPAPVDLRAVTFKELTAVGTRVYSRGDLAVATDLVASGRFDPEPFLTSTVTLDEAAAAIADLRRGVGLKVLVRGDS